MLPRLGPSTAPVSPSSSSKFKLMCTSSADVFRKRQVLSDLSKSVHAGRDSILRFSVRSHIDAFPRLLANGGRFRLPDDRDFYSDALLAAAMPEDDFPAFTTATAILLMDLLQNGEGTDTLFWNWESFESHYRLADPKVRAAIMNAFRLGFETGTVNPDTPPSAADCLTCAALKVTKPLIDAGFADIAEAIASDASADHAGVLWARFNGLADARVVAGFRHLYERPLSLAPPDQETAHLIPWS